MQVRSPLASTLRRGHGWVQAERANLVCLGGTSRVVSGVGILRTLITPMPIGTTTLGISGTAVGSASAQKAEPLTDVEYLLSAGFTPYGAYGPMIVMQLASEAAVGWFKQLILDVADGLREPDLGELQEVHLVNFNRLRLTLALPDATRELFRLGDASGFLWSCSQERWHTNAALLDPFLTGQRGHQYMTSEKIDDALIEVSFGESHPGLSGKSQR